MNMDMKALYKLTYGLYVLGTEYDGKRGGCVVNTLQQITSQPPKLSVAVNRDNFTAKLIADAGKFSAVVLSRDISPELIGRFGFMTGREQDKFDGIRFSYDINECPYPLDGICARFSCKVIGELDADTHILFVARVEEAELIGESEALTYAYYREVIKGTTPKKAPSYQEST